MSIWVIHPDANAIIDKPFEKKAAGFVLWQ
jgi:hypothetical protein